MEIVTKDFKEIFSAEIVSITGGLLAGLLIAVYLEKIYLVPGIFILLPGFLEMRGNISGTLSARLSSALFLGKIKPKFSRGKILNGNVVASFSLVLILSALIGVIAYFANLIFFGQSVIQLIIISLVAGIISNAIEIPLTMATVFWLFRKGHDPDNIMGPYVTTTGDIVSILSLMAALVII